MTARNGSAEWHGDAQSGSGTITVGSARVQLRNIDGAPTLTRVDLDTEGRVAGVNDEEFQRIAQEAKAGCPVSRALAGIPEIVLTAKLV